jgi:endoglycosylceramidase
MRKLVTVPLLLVVALVAALVPSAFAVPVRGFISTRGTSIVNSLGQVVILRGINYPGYQYAEPKLHNSYAYKNFAQLGFNVVRLPISWANLEPQPGMFNAGYLYRYVDHDVQWAKAVGVYIVLDMHQFYWAEKFGGDGAPDWSVQGFAPNELGLRQAVSKFWSDSNLQGHLLSVWTKIARHYANEPTIAGYDILNEPLIYTSIIPWLNATSIDNFYDKAVQGIRSVDKNHIIFLEPSNFNTYKLTTPTNIVWSPHFYPLAFSNKYYDQNFTLLELDFEAKYETFVTELNAPMWIGEFGAFMQDKSSCTKWTQDAINLFNSHNIGWAWWSYNGKSPIPTSLYSAGS